jgi:hypothetical protein
MKDVGTRVEEQAALANSKAAPHHDHALTPRPLLLILLRSQTRNMLELQPTPRTLTSPTRMACVVGITNTPLSPLRPITSSASARITMNLKPARVRPFAGCGTACTVRGQVERTGHGQGRDYDDDNDDDDGGDDNGPGVFFNASRLQVFPGRLMSSSKEDLEYSVYRGVQI